MASKNMMKNTIALVLTINLVFFGFTVAQAPPPQPTSSCPRDIQACVNVLGVGVNLNAQTVSPCCNLIVGLDTPVASACICNAVRLTILNVLTITLRLNEILGLCSIPPAGFTCA